MGASELREWQMFWAREPWGSYRDNLHTGVLASLIVNALRAKGTKAVTYQDFMLVDKDDHRKKKTGETVAWLKAVATPKNKNGKQRK